MSCKPTYKGIRYNTLQEIKDVYDKSLAAIEAAKNDPANILNKQVAEIIGNKEFIKGLTSEGKTVDIDGNEEYTQYINTRTGKTYDRVTNVIDEGKIEQTDILKSAQTIGTQIDKLVRDFFDGKPIVAANYQVAPDEEIDTFIKYLTDIKATMDGRNEKVLANDIVLYNDELGIAGTVDLLTFDMNGEFRIYDMKTMRGNNFEVNPNYPNQPSKYDSTKVFEKTGKFKENGEPKYREVKGATQKSKRQKHAEQVSIYRMLLNNTHGIDAKKLYIMPIVVEYEGGDVATRILEGLNMLEVNPINKIDNLEFKRENTNKTKKKLTNKEKMALLRAQRASRNDVEGNKQIEDSSISEIVMNKCK